MPIACFDICAMFTTMHKAELRMAFALALDAIQEFLKDGKTVELKGIGNIAFTCSGAWTKTAEGDEPSQDTGNPSRGGGSSSGTGGSSTGNEGGME